MGFEHLSKLPDGAMVVSEFTITNYLDADGKSCHAISPVGETSLVQLLGAIELVKFNLLVFSGGSN